MSRRNRQRFDYTPLTDPALEFLMTPHLCAQWDSARRVSQCGWPQCGALVTQATQINQPLLTRADNAGNLVLWSEAFNNPAWVKSGLTVSPDQIANPVNGTTDADLLLETATTSTHAAQGVAAAVLGISYTFSAYIKAGGRGFALMTIGGTSHAISVNLTTGAAVSQFGSPLEISSVDAGGGWWFVSFSAANATAANNHNIYASADGVFANRSYLGDITKGIYVFGASFKPSDWDSRYLPTTDHILTPGLGNGREALRFDGSNDFLLRNTAIPRVGAGQPFTIAAIFRTNTVASDQTIFANTIGANDRAILQVLASGVLSFGVYNGAYLSVSSSALAANTLYLAVCTYDGSAASMRLNRVAQAGVADPAASATVGVSVGANSAGTGTFFNGTLGQQVVLSRYAPELPYQLEDYFRREGYPIP